MEIEKKKMEIPLSKEIQFILSRLQGEGQAYIVGGYLRDFLLGIEAKDCDFVTDLDYERVQELFQDYPILEIGKHFGILQVRIGEHSYEIAKMREDIGKPEQRREQEIAFTSFLEKDLERRDFTVNAFAYDGRVLYASKESWVDIQSKCLRFIRDPLQRMEEDPLRILRAFRFAATKGLEFDISASLLQQHRSLLEKISVERIREEWLAILCSKDLSSLKKMSHWGILSQIIPEWEASRGFDQKNSHHHLTVEEHSLRAVEASMPDKIVRLAVFFHDIAKPFCFSEDERGGHFYGHEAKSAEMAEKILRRMKFDEKTITRVKHLIQEHIYYRKEICEKYIKKLLLLFGEEDIYRFFQVIEADKIAHKPPYDFRTIDKMKCLLHDILSKEEPLRIEDLNISGFDLMKEFNRSGGKWVGELLDYLLEKVLEEPKRNEREELLSLSRNYVRERHC